MPRSSSSGLDSLGSQLRQFEDQNRRLSETIARFASPNPFLQSLERAAEHFQRVHDSYVAGFASSLSALTTASSASTLAAISKTFEASLGILAQPPALITQMEALNRRFEALARPSLQASILASQLAGLSVPFAQIQGIAQLQSLTTSFGDTAAATMRAIGQDVARFNQLPQWLQQAPSVEQYTAGRALAIAAGSGSDVLRENRDPQAEDLLEQIGDELEARLASLDPSFVGPYRGAHAALLDRRPDWPRHVASSLRELVDHLLRRLAPNAELERFLPDPGDLFQNGEFTRKAQLRYIFRNIAVGEYEIMAAKDIDLTLATFYPANATVHTIVSPLNPDQIMVFWRRVQGCVSTVLQAGGY